MELESLTGQPMYTYHLAKGLVELGHEVVATAPRIGGKIKPMFESLGVELVPMITNRYADDYDLIVLAEIMTAGVLDYADGKAYNLLHSKHDLDRPILDDRLAGYIAPRAEVFEHHNESGEIIPIPIDLEKYNKELIPHETYTVLVPCTKDWLRKPMLLDLINRAINDDIEVVMIGDDKGGLDGVETPENVKLLPSDANLVPYMQRADEVAGIFEGTVTFEATAMGLKTSVYDEKGNWEYKDLSKQIKDHDYKKVAQQFLNLI